MDVWTVRNENNYNNNNDCAWFHYRQWNENSNRTHEDLLLSCHIRGHRAYRCINSNLPKPHQLSVQRKMNLTQYSITYSSISFDLILIVVVPFHTVYTYNNKCIKRMCVSVFNVHFRAFTDEIRSVAHACIIMIYGQNEFKIIGLGVCVLAWPAIVMNVREFVYICRRRNHLIIAYI